MAITSLIVVGIGLIIALSYFALMYIMFGLEELQAASYAMIAVDILSLIPAIYMIYYGIKGDRKHGGMVIATGVILLIIMAANALASWYIFAQDANNQPALQYTSAAVAGVAGISAIYAVIMFYWKTISEKERRRRAETRTKEKEARQEKRDKLALDQAKLVRKQDELDEQEIDSSES
jgi:hypothetical protein